MLRNNIIYGWFPGNRPMYDVTSFMVPIDHKNGTIKYIPIDKTTPKPQWDNGVEISSYFHIGGSTVLKKIPNNYYIVGPTYCRNGVSTDSRITVTGKALASVPEINGKLNWRNATFEYFEDAMNRELQEETGLTIKNECMNSIRTHAIIMKHKKTTVATMVVTLNMLELYDPKTMKNSVFINKEGEQLKDNRNFRVQVILAIEKHELEQLSKITNRRHAGDTNSIIGLCAIPRSRFTTYFMHDHCEIGIDNIKNQSRAAPLNNITYAKGPPLDGSNGFNYATR